MTRFLGAVLVTAVVLGPGRAEADKDATAVLDKAVKALGGEANLAKVKAATSKVKGKIRLGDEESEFTSQSTVQGLDHYRQEFEGEFMGNKIMGVIVLKGDKGWRKIGDMSMEMNKDEVGNEKRAVYLQVVASNPLPLKGKGFKVRAAGETKVGGKPAATLKVTPADGKEFTLYYDKASGLPLKMVAKVVGFMGEEFTQETTFADFKDFGGVKRPTRVENKRDGKPFMTARLTSFKVLDKVDPKTFAEPE